MGATSQAVGRWRTRERTPRVEPAEKVERYDVECEDCFLYLQGLSRDQVMELFTGEYADCLEHNAWVHYERDLPEGGVEGAEAPLRLFLKDKA